MKKPLGKKKIKLTKKIAKKNNPIPSLEIDLGYKTNAVELVRKYSRGY